MAFLRQCLQEVRARQGEQNAYFLNDPGWAHGRGAAVFHAGQPSAFQIDPLIHKVDRPWPAREHEAARHPLLISQ